MCFVVARWHTEDNEKNHNELSPMIFIIQTIVLIRYVELRKFTFWWLISLNTLCHYWYISHLQLLPLTMMFTADDDIITDIDFSNDVVVVNNILLTGAVNPLLHLSSKGHWHCQHLDRHYCQHRQPWRATSLWPLNVVIVVNREQSADTQPNQATDLHNLLRKTQ